jgi:hypothetical protein
MDPAGKKHWTLEISEENEKGTDADSRASPHSGIAH